MKAKEKLLYQVYLHCSLMFSSKYLTNIRYIEIKCTSEMDEFQSYVQNKTNQRWIWYAIDKKSGCRLAWHNGKRQDKDFLVLWEL